MACASTAMGRYDYKHSFYGNSKEDPDLGNTTGYKLENAVSSLSKKYLPENWQLSDKTISNIGAYVPPVVGAITGAVATAGGLALTAYINNGTGIPDYILPTLAAAGTGAAIAGKYAYDTERDDTGTHLRNLLTQRRQAEEEQKSR